METETRSKRLTAEQQKLVTDNVKIILKFIKKNRLNYEQFCSLMAIAVCEAALSYDPSKNVDFGTYAWYFMKTEADKELRRITAQKRIPRDKIDSLNKLVPDVDGEEVEYESLLPAKNNTEEDAMLGFKLDFAMKHLTECEKEIIRMFYMNYSLDEIAHIKRCSKQYVSQVKSKYAKLVRS